MLLQVTISGIIAGSIYALIAIGFTVIYRTVKFFHFAHSVVLSLEHKNQLLVFRCWLLGIVPKKFMSREGKVHKEVYRNKPEGD